MSFTLGSRNLVTFALTLSVAVVPTFAAAERPLQLGAIDFPTSGTPAAQRHFIRGVGAMHSFWYEEALEAFRESTRVQPDFLMGYWGEAMALNHPIWEEQNLEAGRQVLSRAPDGGTATARERAYLGAVRLLYGEGDKETRDRAYAEAMGDLYRAHPGDLEAACFYALALLGVAEYEHRGSRTHIQAGAIALEVFRKNPNHPCAAHYAIHAFDDPDHAILALPAARRYAEIAPDAHHALHMPAHIFLQLGMWPEAAAANEAGWQGSVDWVQRDNLPLGLRDYHSLYWLQYVYLQQGRYREAWEVLEQKRADMNAAGSEAEAMSTGYERKVSRNYDEMVAHYVVETERWEAAGDLLPGPGHAQAGAASPLALFTRGYSAAMLKRPEATRALADLQKRQSESDNVGKILLIREASLRAAVAASAGALDQAIAHMRQAVSVEESLSRPSGPPWTIKPPHELLGELLLLGDKPEEAARAFTTALDRHPNRARALLGAARASARTADHRSAARFYRAFVSAWKKADPNRPELIEARRYLQGAKKR